MAAGWDFPVHPTNCNYTERIGTERIAEALGVQRCDFAGIQFRIVIR
jgi:hypothetical protein